MSDVDEVLTVGKLAGLAVLQSEEELNESSLRDDSVHEGTHAVKYFRFLSRLHV